MAFTCSRLSWLFTCERFLTDGRLNTTEFATVRQSIVTVSGLRVAARCDMRVNEETRLRAPCEMLTLSAARFWILDRRRNARLERNLARPSGHSAGCRKVSKTIKESRLPQTRIGNGDRSASGFRYDDRATSATTARIGTAGQSIES